MSLKTVVVCMDEKEGVTMASRLDENGEVVRGKARCVGGDTFRDEIGAIIALCKALNVQPVKACYDVLQAYAKDSGDKVLKASVREHRAEVKKTMAKKKHRKDYKGTPVGMVKTGRCVLKGAGPLANCNYDYGVLGMLTNFYDRNGNQLHVGDLVAVDILEGDVRTGRKWKALPDLTFVVDERSDDPKSKGQYIMGMVSGCNPKTGKIDSRFRVKLVKSWKEVEVGDVASHDMIKVVWEDKG